MKVLVTSIRGTGHVRPLVPYAKALRDAGHTVLFATPEDARPMVESAGIDYAPVDRASDAEQTAFWAANRPADNDDMLRIVVPKMFAGFTAQHARPKLEALVGEFAPDFMLRETCEMAGCALAVARGIPNARVQVHNGEMEAHIVSLAGDAVNALLAQYGAGPLPDAGLKREAAFTAFPEGFDGDASGASDTSPMRVSQRSAGPVPETDWTPRPGRRLVYVTFGTIAGGDAFGHADIFPAALEAVAALDADVLFTTGPYVDPESLGPVPEHVTLRSFVPQDAVLPHADAVLHHGGSGTLIGALAHGTPMVIAPLFADQPFNARRAEAAGLGLAVMDKDPAKLHEALSEVLDRADLRDAGARVAEEMAELPGLDVAVSRMEALAAG